MPKRRDEGCVVDAPLVFKRDFLEEKRALKNGLGQRLGWRLELKERGDLESGDELRSYAESEGYFLDERCRDIGQQFRKYLLQKDELLVRVYSRCRQPTRVPLVNARHRAACLARARQHRDWKRVAWSDESRFRLLNSNGRLRIWRRAHEKMDSACQFGTIQ
ncbi:transposable element Tc1 transposase [Trichonephila clavipes]|nr:transposable element Tc1 transposase [Trichonephila clavipes]